MRRLEFKDLYDGWRREDELARLKLSSARSFALVWPVFCNDPHRFISMKEQFKDIIIQDVQSCWGRCEVDFNESAKEITVTAIDDGRMMELVSGRLL